MTLDQIESRIVEITTAITNATNQLQLLHGHLTEAKFWKEKLEAVVTTIEKGIEDGEINSESTQQDS